jgi:hypothetical protein
MPDDNALTDEQIEAKFAKIEADTAENRTLLQRVLDALKGGAPAPAPAPGGGGAAGDEAAFRAAIRRELEAAGAAEADKQFRSKAEETAASVADLKAQIAALRETPPTPPVRRAERVMGWRG